jgi:hypothetical protein
MRIQMLIGPGWNPFEPLADANEAMIEVDGLERIDTEASAANLSETLARLVREGFPGAIVEILPPDTDNGKLCVVQIEDGDLERLADRAGLPPSEVEQPGFDAERLVRESVYALLREALETSGCAIARE